MHPIYLSKQNIILLPPVQEYLEPQNGGRVFPRNYQDVLALFFYFSLSSSLATGRNEALGWVIFHPTWDHHSFDMHVSI